MLIHFARTLYHRTGLYAAVGWARAWVLGEVVDDVADGWLGGVAAARGR